MGGEQLRALRKELADLTAWRGSVLMEAARRVDEANREFDKRALALNRQIEELAPVPSCPTCGYKYGQHKMTCAAAGKMEVRIAKRKPKPKAVRLTGTEGWPQEDIDHYKALQLQNTGG